MIENLSEREIEVLRLVAAGHNNRAIAAELKISRRTVETHRAKMRMRTQLGTEELIQHALRAGLLEKVEAGEESTAEA
jgi:two-component system response regulator NreC